MQFLTTKNNDSFSFVGAVLVLFWGGLLREFDVENAGVLHSLFLVDLTVVDRVLALLSA